MPKLKLGNLVQDVRGSLAGITFTRARGLSTARTKSAARRADHPIARAQQSYFGVARAYWRQTTATDRADWQRYADAMPGTDSLGDKRRLTAYNAFLSVNLVRQAQGLAPRLNPYTLPPPPPPSPAAIEFATTGAILSGVVATGLPEDLDFTTEWFMRAPAGTPAQFAHLGGIRAGTIFAVEIHFPDSTDDLWVSWSDGWCSRFVPWSRIGDDQWHHVAAVYSPSHVGVYVDGLLASTGDEPHHVDTVASPTEYRFGIAAQPLAMPWRMSQLRVSAGARYVAPFTPPALLSPDASSLAAYTFTEGTGPIVSGVGPLAAELTLGPGCTWHPV